METLTTCPVCSKNELTDYIKCKDFTVSGNWFNIQHCSNCSFLFTNPRPDQNEIGPYYKSDNYISHSNKSNGLFNKTYQFIRNIAINKKIELIKSLFTGKEDIKLLDIGCGTGEFLSACAKSGWEVEGVEPSEDARSKAKELHQLKVNDEDSLEINQKQYDVITMWHVLEHVHSLNKRIDQLSKLIAKNGHVIIAVPNHTSQDAGEFKENWAAWDVPRHLYHFSPSTIKKIMSNHGFKHIKSMPMVFDSYYVSLLSTQYEAGSKNYLKGVWTGWRSNQSAGKNAENYSSVIYIFTK